MFLNNIVIKLIKYVFGSLEAKKGKEKIKRSAQAQREKEETRDSLAGTVLSWAAQAAVRDSQGLVA